MCIIQARSLYWPVQINQTWSTEWQKRHASICVLWCSRITDRHSFHIPNAQFSEICNKSYSRYSYQGHQIRFIYRLSPQGRARKAICLEMILVRTTQRCSTISCIDRFQCGIQALHIDCLKLYTTLLLITVCGMAFSVISVEHWNKIYFVYFKLEDNLVAQCECPH